MVRFGSILIAILLVLPVVIAAPPSSVFSAEQVGEISVQYPKFDHHKSGEPFKLHFHVFNETGYPLTNTTTNCTLHVYNHTSSHVIRANATYDGSEWEFAGITLNETGNYAYITWCVTTGGRGGYVSVPFEITSDGGPTNIDLWPVAALILAPILFAFLLLFGASLFDPEEHSALRLFLFLISILMVFVSFGIGAMTSAKYYEWDALTEFLADFSNIAGWGVIVFVILYWLIYFIYKTFKEMESRKDY